MSTGRSPDAIILASPQPWGGQRKVLRWLLASLFLHVALGWWWQGRLALPVYQAPDISPTLELRLRKAQSSVPEAESEADQYAEPRADVFALPTDSATPGQVPLAETADAPGHSPQNSTQASDPLASPLDLSLPDVVPEAPAATDNGATVIDPTLYQLLQQAPRRTGYAARSERGASGEFQAGGWVEFVRDGDRCFRVARADPLASYDYDVWYVVPCP